MVKRNEKILAKVRVFRKEQIEFKFGYFDVYPNISVDVYQIIPENDRNDLETLIKDLDETEYVDVNVKVAKDDFLQIQDDYNVKLSQECVRLSQENLIIYKYLQERVTELEEFIDTIELDAVYADKWKRLKEAVS